MSRMFSIRHYDTIDSTNDEARRLVRDGAPHGTVVHADQQTAGRGRMTRPWFSPPGNLYLSVILCDVPLARASELSFLCALAVADTVQALLPRRVQPMLKWPNDVLVNGAKIAGILLEQEGDSVIPGMGVNVLHAPANNHYNTTTIVANGGIASVDSARDILLDRLGHHLHTWLTDGFAPIRTSWLDRSYPIGASIRVSAHGESIEGAFGGLDQDGALLLDTPDGRQRVLAGEVTIDPPQA